MPYIKGQSGNLSGRPIAPLVQKFRENPKGKLVIEKILNVANTLGTKNEHKDATTCARIVADKLIPTLKMQEIDMIGDLRGEIGVILLPIKKKVGAEVDGGKSTLETESGTTDRSTESS